MTPVSLSSLVDYLFSSGAKPLMSESDVDCNCLVDPVDLAFMVDYLFRGGSAPLCVDHADLNGSGDVNVSDLSYFVDYLFRGGPEPVPCP